MSNMSVRLLFCITLVAAAGMAVWAGSLTPPPEAFDDSNNPKGYMKTLNETEPRTAIAQKDMPLVITNSGSYYLTESLLGQANTNGIEITANNVHLDLNGFTLGGVSNSWSGIYASGSRRNITVANGVLRGWGWYGLDAGGADDSHVIDVKAYTNSSLGIYVGDGCSVVRCTAASNGGSGIYAGSNCNIDGCTSRSNGSDGFYVGDASKVTGCIARDNTRDGIDVSTDCRVVGSIAKGNGEHGIEASSVCNIIDCVSRGNAQDGIYVTDDCTIRDCTAANNTVDGIQVSDGCRVVDNNANGNGTGSVGCGIYATGTGNRIQDNNVRANDIGIKGPRKNNFT